MTAVMPVVHFILKSPVECQERSIREGSDNGLSPPWADQRDSVMPTWLKPEPFMTPVMLFPLRVPEKLTSS